MTYSREEWIHLSWDHEDAPLRSRKNRIGLWVPEEVLLPPQSRVGGDRGCCWRGMFRTMDLPGLSISTGELSGAASSEEAKESERGVDGMPSTLGSRAHCGLSWCLQQPSLGWSILAPPAPIHTHLRRPPPVGPRTERVGTGPLSRRPPTKAQTLVRREDA